MAPSDAAPAIRAYASRSWFSSVERRRWLFCYFGLIPILLMYLILRLIPISQTFVYSFFDSTVVNPTSNFIGMANFSNLLGDELFQTALKNTFLFAGGTVLLSVTLGLALALMVNNGSPIRPLYETIYFLPVITPMVPVAVIWKWIYDPSYGLLNYVLSWFSLEPVGWLVYPDLALWAIVIMNVWKVVGYNMVIFLVGLRAIPASTTRLLPSMEPGGWQPCAVSPCRCSSPSSCSSS